MCFPHFPQNQSLCSLCSFSTNDLQHAPLLAFFRFLHSPLSMAAASTAGLVQQHHVVPIVSVFQATENNSVYLSPVVDIGRGLIEKRKFQIPKVSNLDVETICHCILEFTDVATAGRLNLTSDPVYYSYFS